MAPPCRTGPPSECCARGRERLPHVLAAASSALCAPRMPACPRPALFQPLCNARSASRWGARGGGGRRVRPTRGLDDALAVRLGRVALASPEGNALNHGEACSGVAAAAARGRREARPEGRSRGGRGGRGFRREARRSGTARGGSEVGGGQRSAQRVGLAAGGPWTHLAGELRKRTRGEALVRLLSLVPSSPLRLPTRQAQPRLVTAWPSSCLHPLADTAQTELTCPRVAALRGRPALLTRVALSWAPPC